jgi:hypothetical protein
MGFAAPWLFHDVMPPRATATDGFVDGPSAFGFLIAFEDLSARAAGAVIAPFNSVGIDSEGSGMREALPIADFPESTIP